MLRNNLLLTQVIKIQIFSFLAIKLCRQFDLLIIFFQFTYFSNVRFRLNLMVPYTFHLSSLTLSLFSYFALAFASTYIFAFVFSPLLFFVQQLHFYLIFINITYCGWYFGWLIVLSGQSMSMTPSATNKH